MTVVACGALMGRAARAGLPPRIAKSVIAIGNYVVGEPELRFLRILCDKAKCSIDVGANVGAYTYFMRRWSRSCVAFEPNPASARFLRLAYLAYPDVVVQQVALSDMAIDGALFGVPDPKEDPAAAGGHLLAQEGSRAQAGEFATLRVQTGRLDDFAIHDVGLIKIDTEGHELAVLRGGLATISTYKPRLIVECEERHRPGALASVVDITSGQGYVPLCLTVSGRYESFESARRGYDRAATQNFVFLHKDDDLLGHFTH